MGGEELRNMREKECEVMVGLIQEVILEWEGANISSRKALLDIKKIANRRKSI